MGWNLKTRSSLGRQRIRYACSVCHHRPVFDTIDILSVHRTGKKHLSCLQGFYWKKTDFKNEVQKRQHHEYVRAEEAGEQTPAPAPLLAKTRKITHHALLKSAPYNSCCSRNGSEDAGKKIIPPIHNPSQFRSSEINPAVISLSESGKSPQPEPCGSSAGVPINKKTKKSIKDKKAVQKRVDKEATSCEDPEKKRELKHYLFLRSSGWIPDGTGKWVKDENVEFDSDEEEPPPMQP
ncbi:sodium channel modifier 1 isoform X2 [Hyperolius riggenbachi]|uniref:sodium channel modifier 1 isoform X2 n=1 Tax=Hyperolius riggenbachi TaxID=752182 RepID=UPI0035A30F4A